jgi:hypothetical protein
MKYPATKTCHWVTGPVHACDDHAEQLLALGGFMGTHVAVTTAPDGAECSNCINENRAEAV